MKCQGKFKYKGIEKKDAGTFVNAQGQKIDYPARYALKVDEVGEGGVFERVFKVAIDSPILAQLTNKEIYADMILEFDIQFSQNGTPKITPVNVIK